MIHTRSLALIFRRIHANLMVKSLLVFNIIYFGIPFSIADSSIALGNITFSFEKETKEKLINDFSEAEAFNDLDQSLEYFTKSQRLVGLSVGVIKDGQLVYAKGFGYADKDNEETLQPYHLMRIGSVSKLITAVGIMKLIDDGKLTLDDQVFGEGGILKYGLYDVIKDKKYHQITVEHLLNHTAGWSKRSYGDPMFIPHRVATYMDTDLPVNLDKIIEFVISNHLPYRPGSYYDYSNFGYCVLGKVIERVSGMSYEDYIKAEILRPLGITNMQLAKNWLEDKLDNEVSYYDHVANNMRLSLNGSGEQVPSPYGGFDIEALSAAGGWLATPGDLLKFLTAIDGFKNTPDILTNHSLLTMTSPERGRPYGWRSANAEGTWWRTGTLAGASAMMKRKPNGISWVVITNTSNRRSGSFHSRVSWLMDSQLEKIKDWPQRDFFALNF